MITDFYPKEEKIRAFCFPHEDIDSWKYKYQDIEKAIFNTLKLLSESKNEKLRNQSFFIFKWDFKWNYMVWFRDNMTLYSIFRKGFDPIFWSDLWPEWLSRPACQLIIKYKYDKWTIIEFDEDMAVSHEEWQYDEENWVMIKYWVLYPDSFRSQ